MRQDQTHSRDARPRDDFDEIIAAANAEIDRIGGRSAEGEYQALLEEQRRTGMGFRAVRKF